MKKILYIATILILVDYLFWEQIESYLGFYVFERIQAIFISLLCMYLYLTDKRSLIKFALFAMSINNVIDELLETTNKLQLNELLTAVSIIIFLLIRMKNDREKSRFV